MIRRMMTMTLAAALSLLLWTPALLAQEHPTPAAGAAATEHGGHESLPLLPDLHDKSTYYEALWVVIIFVVLLVILYPTAWKNVLAGLKRREERIRKDIAEAEAARLRAEATLREYNSKLAEAESSMRDILAKAAADAEKLATSIRMKAQAEAEDIKEKANRDIETARDQAVREIHTYTADLATKVAEKIIRRSLNASDQEELVRQSLEQLQTVK